MTMRVLLVAATLFTGLVPCACASGGGASSGSLSNVSASQLPTSADVRLFKLLAEARLDVAPTTGSPEISAAEAEQTALKSAVGDHPVVDSMQLVIATDPSPDVTRATCWLIAFDPSTSAIGYQGPAAPDSTKVPPAPNYSVALVDAASGKLLGILSGHAPI